MILKEPYLLISEEELLTKDRIKEIHREHRERPQRARNKKLS